MIKYCFRGNIANYDIQNYYHDNWIDCFITTSSTEGLPVSIMEAMSYGIPIIATNVGGISELVDNNGVLLQSNPNEKDICDALIKLIDSEETTINQMRINSFDLWEKSFDATKNARLLVDEINNKCKEDNTTIVIVIDSVEADWCFIRNEVIGLSQNNKLIIIETEPPINEIKRKKEIEIVNNINEKIDLIFYDNKNKSVSSYLKYFVDKKTALERKTIFHTRKRVMRRLWESVKYYEKSKRFYEWYVRNIKKRINKCICYTFWMKETTLAFCLHKNSKIVTRAHGYDLYNERYTKGFRQPFREFMNTQLDGIYFISKDGEKYYKERWNNIDDSATKVIYLGSNKVYEDIKRIKKNDNLFRIVSCSNLIPLKRVNLIIEALSLLAKKKQDINIQWIHFGDGECRKQLELLAKAKLGNTLNN